MWAPYFCGVYVGEDRHMPILPRGEDEGKEEMRIVRTLRESGRTYNALLKVCFGLLKYGSKDSEGSTPVFGFEIMELLKSELSSVEGIALLPAKSGFGRYGQWAVISADSAELGELSVQKVKEIASINPFASGFFDRAEKGYRHACGHFPKMSGASALDSLREELVQFFQARMFYREGGFRDRMLDARVSPILFVHEPVNVNGNRGQYYFAVRRYLERTSKAHETTSFVPCSVPRDFNAVSELGLEGLVGKELFSPPHKSSDSLEAFPGGDIY